MSQVPKFWLVVSVLLAVALGLTGCQKEKKPPELNQFRILKTRLNAVQQAVKSGRHQAIDSLLISGLRDEPEGAESLLSFVQGDSPEFMLESFADYDIFYTHTKARIDCYLANADNSVRRPATFTFELVDSLWLLKRWEPGLQVDTTSPE